MNNDIFSMAIIITFGLIIWTAIWIWFGFKLCKLVHRDKFRFSHSSNNKKVMVRPQLINEDDLCPNCQKYFLRKCALDHKECKNCGAIYFKREWG